MFGISSVTFDIKQPIGNTICQRAVLNISTLTAIERELNRKALTVSLKDLKAAPSAITPDCLVEICVEVAVKSDDPEPLHKLQKIEI